MVRKIIFALAFVLIALAIFFNNTNCARYIAKDGIVEDYWELATIMQYRLLLIFIGLLLFNIGIFLKELSIIFIHFDYKKYAFIVLGISTLLVMTT